MRRTLLTLVLAAVACGGSPKPTTAPPPLEGSAEQGSADATTEAKKEKPPAPPPEPPPGPLDLTIPAPKVTVKLVSPGKGKRTPVKVAPKAGDKQLVELALDFSGSQTAPPEAPEQIRGTKADVAPTLVLTGNAEVKNVDAGGTTEYELTVDGTDVRDVKGQQVPSDLMKKALASLNTLKIGGTVAANGVGSDLKLHVDKADKEAAGALELVRVEVLPSWPVLPTEPIGVGAKWQVTSTTKLADKLDVTQTTDYELLKHDGKTWTIKGTTKVSGTDQDVDQAKLTNITGSGTVDVAMVEGALYPTMKAQVTTGFAATVTPPPGALPPGSPSSLQITYELKQGSTVTPNPTPTAPAAPSAPPATPKPGQ
jgi:hypothetical protein